MKSYLKWHAMIVGISVLLLLPKMAYSDEPVLPEAFKNGIDGKPVEKPYWELFNDPVLNKLVRFGLSKNYDLKATSMRIRQAEALAKQASAPLLPMVSASAGYTLRPYEKLPIPAALGGNTDDPKVVHNLSASLSADYMVDITGRNRLTKQAAMYDVAAGKLDAQTQATTLISLIVKAYFSVCQARLQQALVEEQIETNKTFLELVEAQFNVGAATAIDVLQQRQQLDSIKSRLPLVKMIVESNIQQLATLVGNPDTSKLPDIQGYLPDTVPLPPTGTPVRLLHARADLRAKSTRIEALLMKEKSAFRALLPSLTVSGSIGYGFTYDNDESHGETWSIGALISVPLYQGGANRAAIEQARATTLSEVYSLQQSAISAVSEVETALSMVRLQRENLAAIERQLEASKTTFNEARKRYAVGLSNYLTVLTVLSAYQQIQLTKLQARLDVLNTSINLMNALGGEWTKNVFAAAPRRER